MRVLQITAFSGWGCTGRIALGIHNELIRNGHESMIAWGRVNTAPKDVKTIKIGNKLDQNIHGLYTRITDKCGFASKKVTKEFIEQVDRFQPSLIHLHILHGYYINLELLFNYIKEHNIPVVWTFHDCWAFTGHCPYFDQIGCEKWITGCFDCPQKSHHPRSWLLDNSKWNWNKKREIFNGVNKMTIVTPSHWLASLVKQSFLKDYPVTVINNGINTTNFKPTYGEFKKKYSLGEKKIVLGVSSTWCYSKGFDDFIKLSKVLNENYCIVLVGLSKYQIKKLPSNILGIERIDNVKELAEIYTAADVFVNPTYEDNYPTTNLEALACDTPVITYKTGGSIEAVKGIQYGAIIEQGNIKQMTEQIGHYCNSKKKKLEFKWDETEKFAEYVELYKSLT